MADQSSDPFKAKNEAEPSLQEKHQEFSKFVEKCKFCMMTTKSSDGKLASRCMALASKENNDVDFIFHANNDSGKAEDVNNSPDVNLGFLNSAGEWASVSGQAKIETDKEEIRKYYTPALKVWLGDLGDGKHDGGPDDPRIAMIRIKSDTVSYSVSGKGLVGQVVEAVQAIVSSEPPAINKLVFISEQELEQIRKGS